MNRTPPRLEACNTPHLTFEQSHIADSELANCKEVARHHLFRRSGGPFRKEICRPTALHPSGGESFIDGLG
jgi:hypothetical protein